MEEELAGIHPQKIYLGYQTDPYQPMEAELKQTRIILEIFLRKGFSASILTKSDLVLRDIDILKKMEDPSVSFSIAFTDDKIRKILEENTINTERRINALGKIREAGINTSALLCPVIPYITDAEKLINSLKGKAGTIWVYGLSFLNEEEPSRNNTLKILEDHFPGEKEQIIRAVFNKQDPWRSNLREKLNKTAVEKKPDLRIHL